MLVTHSRFRRTGLQNGPGAPESVGATTSGDLLVACGRWHGARGWLVGFRASAHQRCRHRRTALMPARARRFFRFHLGTRTEIRRTTATRTEPERDAAETVGPTTGQGPGDAARRSRCSANILELRSEIKDLRMGPWHEHQGCASVATSLMRRSSGSTDPATGSVPPATGHL